MGNLITKLQRQLERLELLPTTLDNIKALRETLVELNCWLDKEDMMWNQRS